MSSLELTSPSPDYTRHVGYLLGQLLQAGDVICLSGELGAGKTTFSAGIGQGWGAEQPLTSPTFVIIHQHTRPTDSQLLYHVDAYRIGGEDAASIGLDDLWEGVVIMEWAAHLRPHLPNTYVWVNLDYGEDEATRYFSFTAQGSRAQALLKALQAQLETA